MGFKGELRGVWSHGSHFGYPTGWQDHLGYAFYIPVVRLGSSWAQPMKCKDLSLIPRTQIKKPNMEVPEWVEHLSCFYKFPWECNVQLALVLDSADKKAMA